MTNTATNTARYNKDLNITEAEKAEILKIEKMSSRSQRRKKHILINRFIGLMIVLLSLFGFVATYCLGDMESGAFLVVALIGLAIAAQKEEIFNF